MKLTKADKEFLHMSFWEIEHTKHICNLEAKYIKSCKKLYPESVVDKNRVDFTKMDPKKYTDEYVLFWKNLYVDIEEKLCNLQQTLVKLSEL